MSISLVSMSKDLIILEEGEPKISLWKNWIPL